MKQEITTTPKNSALSLMASRLSVDPAKLLDTLKNTVFKGATNDELLALVVVANQYGLSPFLKEIYAFPAKGGGIVPVVSVDGWIRMMNDHPQFDGIDYEWEREGGKLISCTAIIHRKDRAHPTRVTEYLAECKRATDPWKMEHRMLRHKATIQGARVAFGFSGIMEEDEADRMSGTRDVTPARVPFVTAAPVAVIEETTSAESPLYTLGGKLKTSGLTWAQVASEAEAGGIFIDTGTPMEEQPESVLTQVLGAFDGIAKSLEGGAV